MSCKDEHIAELEAENKRLATRVVELERFKTTSYDVGLASAHRIELRKEFQERIAEWEAKAEEPISIGRTEVTCKCGNLIEVCFPTNSDKDACITKLELERDRFTEWFESEVSTHRVVKQRIAELEIEKRALANDAKMQVDYFKMAGELTFALKEMAALARPRELEILWAGEWTDVARKERNTQVNAIMERAGICPSESE